MKYFLIIAGMAICFSGLYFIVFYESGVFINKDDVMSQRSEDSSINDSDADKPISLRIDRLSELVLESYRGVDIKKIENFPNISEPVTWVKYDSEIKFYAQVLRPGAIEVHRFDTPLRTAIEYSYNWFVPDWTDEWCKDTFFNDSESLEWHLVGRDDFKYSRDHALKLIEEVKSDEGFTDENSFIGELRYANEYERAIVVLRVEAKSANLSFISGTPVKKVGSRWYVDYMSDDVLADLEESLLRVMAGNE